MYKHSSAYASGHIRKFKVKMQTGAQSEVVAGVGESD